MKRVVAAWVVHGLTASGAVMGIAAVIAAADGDAATAVLWMLAALAVDSVDGTLARRVDVRAATPAIDGRRLDDIIDYENFVVVPVLFMLFCGALPDGALGWGAAAAAAIASGFGFSHAQAKSADHFFRGFPSYWNVVAFYAWFLEWNPVFTAALIFALAVSVGLPIHFLYPSRAPRFRRSTVGAGVLWGACLVVAALFPRAPWTPSLVWTSLAYPAWYLSLSLWLSGRRAGPP